jgi:hypothetical protein
MFCLPAFSGETLVQQEVRIQAIRRLATAAEEVCRKHQALMLSGSLDFSVERAAVERFFKNLEEDRKNLVLGGENRTRQFDRRSRFEELAPFLQDAENRARNDYVAALKSAIITFNHAQASLPSGVEMPEDIKRTTAEASKIALSIEFGEAGTYISKTNPELVRSLGEKVRDAELEYEKSRLKANDVASQLQNLKSKVEKANTNTSGDSRRSGYMDMDGQYFALSEKLRICEIQKNKAAENLNRLRSYYTALGGQPAPEKNKSASKTGGFPHCLIMGDGTELVCRVIGETQDVYYVELEGGEKKMITKKDVRTKTSADSKSDK